jgi:hypothetical protein
LFGAIALLPFVFYSIWRADSKCLVQIFSTSRGAPCWSNSGAFFAVLAGLLTLLGLLATVLKIESQSVNVINYEVLMNKLINFVNETIKKDHKLSALLQTPLVGNISLPRESNRLGEDLKEALRKSRIELICLRPNDLDGFYESLKETIPKAKVRTINKYSEQAKRWLNSLTEAERANVRYYKAEQPSPTYHMIFAPQKGFLFIPFFRGKKYRGIEIFCLELSDPAIIASYLEKTFDYYRKISEPANSGC